MMKTAHMAALVIACAAFGQTGFAHPMQGMQMPSPSTNEPAATKAYRSAMSKMEQNMAVTFTGDADKDFVAGMIAHHEGAVEMAKVELQYGKDPQLRKLAGDVIAAQTKEIAFMKSWQAKHAK
jgi:uncharacterized protein (DUF305 family)